MKTRNRVKIVKFKKNYKLVIKKDGADEVIAEVYDQMDALLLSYMIEIAYNGEFNENDFKDYIIEVGKDAPFITIPKQ